MSNRTIVEFNHDFAFEISKDPETFVELIKDLLRSGVNCNPENIRGDNLLSKLEEFGITATPTTHHSDKRTVILGNHYIEL